MQFGIAHAAVLLHRVGTHGRIVHTEGLAHLGNGLAPCVQSGVQILGATFGFAHHIEVGARERLRAQILVQLLGGTKQCFVKTFARGVRGRWKDTAEYGTECAFHVVRMGHEPCRQIPFVGCLGKHFPGVPALENVVEFPRRQVSVEFAFGKHAGCHVHGARVPRSDVAIEHGFFEHARGADQPCRVPTGDVPIEAAAREHIFGRAKRLGIPLGDVARERAVLEHVGHVQNLGGVPTGDVPVEECACEKRLHVRHAGDIQMIQIARGPMRCNCIQDKAAQLITGNDDNLGWLAHGGVKGIASLLYHWRSTMVAMMPSNALHGLRALLTTKNPFALLNQAIGKWSTRRIEQTLLREEQLADEHSMEALGRRLYEGIAPEQLDMRAVRWWLDRASELPLTSSLLATWGTLVSTVLDRQTALVANDAARVVHYLNTASGCPQDILFAKGIPRVHTSSECGIPCPAFDGLADAVRHLQPESVWRLLQHGGWNPVPLLEALDACTHAMKVYSAAKNPQGFAQKDFKLQHALAWVLHQVLCEYDWQPPPHTAYQVLIETLAVDEKHRDRFFQCAENDMLMERAHRTVPVDLNTTLIFLQRHIRHLSDTSMAVFFPLPFASLNDEQPDVAMQNLLILLVEDERLGHGMVHTCMRIHHPDVMAVVALHRELTGNPDFLDGKSLVEPIRALLGRSLLPATVERDDEIASIQQVPGLFSDV